MPKTKISEFSATPGNNTDIDGINIAEGCAPSGINDAIRELMAQLKDFQAGTAGDSFNGPVGTSTAAAGAFTTLSATGVTTVQAGTAGAPAITTTGDTNTGIFFPAADTVAASVGGTEGLRLTSTGLGIGTSSPAYKLDVRGDVVGGFNSKIGVRRSDGAFVSYLQNAGDTETRLVADGGGSFLTFFTEGTVKARLSPEGNLGLGVTPPASGSRAIYTGFATSASLCMSMGASGGSYGVVGYNTGITNTSNAYNYMTADTASAIRFSAGGFHFLTAPSGTAGNAITFTQAMTLDASGRLLVGTTTAADSNAMLNVYNPNATSAQIALQNTTTGTGSNGSRLLATGNDLYVTNKENGFMAFETNDTERARITSGGDLLVGRTSAGLTTAGAGVIKNAGGAYLEVVQGTNGVACMYLNQSNGSGTQTVADFRYNNTQVGTINVTSTACTYNNLSDYRLKTVIGSVSGAGARIDALEPVEYEWKVNGARTRGFLAHKFQEVYPQSVAGEKDAVDAKGKPVYQSMQASTSEVIADLVAEIQSLRARVAALESNP